MYGHSGVRGTGLSLPYAAEPTRPLQAQWIPVFAGKLTTCYEPSCNACLFDCLIPCRVLCLSSVILLCLSAIIIACLYVVHILYEPCIVVCLSCCILSYCITIELLICASLTFPRQWPVVPPQSKEWGNYYNCASRACGALFASFFFAEVRSGRMSSYDPRSWGHSPKELVALSLRQIWLA